MHCIVGFYITFDEVKHIMFFAKSFAKNISFQIKDCLIGSLLFELFTYRKQ